MILLAPYSKPLRNSAINPKDYPNWGKVIDTLRNGNDLIQLAYGNEKSMPGVTNVFRYTSLKQVEQLVDRCETWISVDNFLQHLAHHRSKLGVVIWGQSDPMVFGYSENVNLLKDRKYLRKDQFGTWEETTFNPDTFVDPEKVVEAVRFLVSKRILGS